jgi:hypothetical protein
MRIRPVSFFVAVLLGLFAGLPTLHSEAASLASGSARYQPQAPAQVVPLAKIGVPKAILDPSGVRLSAVVNDFQSPPKGIDGSPPGGGRWAVLDVTVTNVGTRSFDLSPGYFLLMAPDTTIFQPDGDAGLPSDPFPVTHLQPGDSIRGNVIYALPGGAQVQLVAFQAPGTSQWVVALLNA